MFKLILSYLFKKQITINVHGTIGRYIIRDITFHKMVSEDFTIGEDLIEIKLEHISIYKAKNRIPKYK